MKNFLLTFLLLALSPLRLFAAGEDCSSPIPVTVCPTVTLTGQSSTGKINDVSSWKTGTQSWATVSTTGEDIVYEVTYPSGATALQLSMINTSKSGYVFVTPTCATNSGTLYTFASFYTGSTYNISLPLPSTGTSIFLHVDHSGSANLTYDISFGAVVKGTVITIPDKRGVLEFAKVKCVTPVFRYDFGVMIDGVVKVPPTDFGSLNTVHSYCFDVYLQNLTGIEGTKKIIFTFNNFNSVSVPTPSASGFYSVGSWVATVSGNAVTWVYTNANNADKGDYDDVTKSCLKYSFCMNAKPLNNSTTFNIDVRGDGETPGYTGFQYNGCCAAGSCPAYGAGGSSLRMAATAAGSGGSAAFGTSAGPSGLPLHFLDLWTEQLNDRFIVNWKTTQEKNVDYFIPQISTDGIAFEDMENTRVAAEGNQAINTYTIDVNGYANANYFRIKAIDRDGSEQFSKFIRTSHSIASKAEIQLSPNPVQDILRVQSAAAPTSYKLYDLTGNCVLDQSLHREDHASGFYIDLSSYKKGIYTLQVFTETGAESKRVIKE